MDNPPPESAAEISPTDGPGDITRLLERVHGGERGALEALCERCLPEIKSLARAAIRDAGARPELQTTVVAHDVFLKLHDRPAATHWDGRRHYFGSARNAALQVVTDWRRRKATRLRAHDTLRETIVDRQGSTDLATSGTDAEELSRLIRAMELLNHHYPRAAQVVKFRMLFVLSEAAIATRLGVSRRTVQNDWRFARAFLRDAMDNP